MTSAFVPIQRLGEPAPEDEFLVARALDGDLWAEEALYRRHVATVLSLARRMLRNDADAEDVVQQSFLRWLSAGCPALDSPRAWFTRTCVRLCLDRLKSAFDPKGILNPGKVL